MLNKRGAEPQLLRVLTHMTRSSRKWGGGYQGPGMQRVGGCRSRETQVQLDKSKSSQPGVVLNSVLYTWELLRG